MGELQSTPYIYGTICNDQESLNQCLLSTVNCSQNRKPCSSTKGQQIMNFKATKCNIMQSCFNVYSTMNTVFRMVILAVQPKVNIKTINIQDHVCYYMYYGLFFCLTVNKMHCTIMMYIFLFIHQKYVPILHIIIPISQ